ncbi:hypothetical protein PoB_000807700 [Plakobranchus ocellatus]|uniref:Uncharacterized protein n=1 Tax=Plakobranchus ocellatus TaxID=259542 RepID=A0AAV3YFE4_9GAST|nr:hypothetical protein PoB_000807700 [Plakobranchus ocellatus]
MSSGSLPCIHLFLSECQTAHGKRGKAAQIYQTKPEDLQNTGESPAPRPKHDRSTPDHVQFPDLHNTLRSKQFRAVTSPIVRQCFADLRIFSGTFQGLTTSDRGAGCT